MKIITRVDTDIFPFDWVNVDTSYSESKGERIEIYLKVDFDLTTNLIFLFYNLFGEIKEDILIYDKSWWNFTLDTFNITSEKGDYGIENKPEQTRAYLKMLLDSEIPFGYSGSCRCLNWDKFLSNIVDCVVTHIAPYSPIFYNVENNLFFYFHHTGSIGLYYKELTPYIEKLLRKSAQEYILEE